MNEKVIIGIDQSTQGTKAVALNTEGELIGKSFLPHDQLVNEKGWVSHDGTQIMNNVIQVVKDLVEEIGFDKSKIAAIGISNQRETTIAWNKKTGEPVDKAIVWQCARATEIVAVLPDDFAALVKERTGIPLSPYFPAAKASWLLQNNEEARRLAKEDSLCIGTIDAWVVYNLTKGTIFKTDYSNASRTQLFDLQTLCWNEEICKGFGIPVNALPKVEDSDGDFGETTLNGFLDTPVPIRCVMGDSHAALFGQGCFLPGMAKATYGTGSSIMMNIGETLKTSKHGLVTSLAWGRSGKVNYVLEGNINYSGAIITWLQKDLGLVQNAGESEQLAKEANPADETYLVPAFSGLGAPWWNSEARAAFVGMSRTTGRKELVKAGLEAIAYQVTDIVEAMNLDTGLLLSELRVDGGPTANSFLMQLQSDLTRAAIRVPKAVELSAIGVASMAGIAVGVMEEKVLIEGRAKKSYLPQMEEETRRRKYDGWKAAIQKTV